MVAGWPFHHPPSNKRSWLALPVLLVLVLQCCCGSGCDERAPLRSDPTPIGCGEPAAGIPVVRRRSMRMEAPSSSSTHGSHDPRVPKRRAAAGILAASFYFPTPRHTRTQQHATTNRRSCAMQHAPCTMSRTSLWCVPVGVRWSCFYPRPPGRKILPVYLPVTCCCTGRR